MVSKIFWAYFMFSIWHKNTLNFSGYKSGIQKFLFELNGFYWNNFTD